MQFAEGETPTPLRQKVIALQRGAWPPRSDESVKASTLTHDPNLGPVSVLLVTADGVTADRVTADHVTADHVTADDAANLRVLAALDILSKEIVHAGQCYAARGLSTVVTAHDARGLGHGHRLVSHAHGLISASGADIGLFTCDRELQRFYERAGWQLLPGAVLIGGTTDDPFPSDQPDFDKVTMAGFFSARAQRHRHEFEHSRIALYPGLIDKLW